MKAESKRTHKPNPLRVSQAREIQTPVKRKHCAARTKAGERCPNSAMVGRRVCHMHTPSFVKRIGAIGGRRRCKYNLDEVEPFTQPQTARDVAGVLSQVMCEVHTGKCEPRVANALAYLASSYLGAMAVVEFGERISALEEAQQLEQRELPKLQAEEVTADEKLELLPEPRAQA